MSLSTEFRRNPCLFVSQALYWLLFWAIYRWLTAILLWGAYVALRTFNFGKEGLKAGLEDIVIWSIQSTSTWFLEGVLFATVGLSIVAALQFRPQLFRQGVIRRTFWLSLGIIAGLLATLSTHFWGLNDQLIFNLFGPLYIPLMCLGWTVSALVGCQLGWRIGVFWYQQHHAFLLCLSFTGLTILVMMGIALLGYPRLSKSFVLQANQVLCLATTPDRQEIIVASGDRPAVFSPWENWRDMQEEKWRIWDVVNVERRSLFFLGIGRLIQQLPLSIHPRPGCKIALNQDGTVLAMSDPENQSIQRWDLERNEPLSPLTLQGYQPVDHVLWIDPFKTLPVIWGLDDRALIVLDVNNEIQIFDAESQETIPRFLPPLQDQSPYFEASAIHHQPPLLARSLAFFERHRNSQVIEIWNWQTGKQIEALNYPLSIQGSITSLAFSPSGKLLAAGFEGRQVYIWSVETGEIQYRLLAWQTCLFGISCALQNADDGLPVRNNVTTVAFGPNDSMLLVGGRQVQIWQLSSNGKNSRSQS